MINPEKARRILLLLRRAVLPLKPAQGFICAGFLALAATMNGQPTAGYQFEAGEPLAYKMELAVTNQSSTEMAVLNGSKNARSTNTASFAIDYQLMPILQDEAGVWKIRLVLDKVEQMLNLDGEIKKKTFDRAALLKNMMSGSHIMKSDLQTQLYPPLEESNIMPGISTAVPLHTSEELFDDPILLWIAPNGALKSFEDRTELKSVVPGVNIKECLELALPPLLATQVKEGTSWTRETPLDLPQAPLAGNAIESMKLQLVYTVKGTENFHGKPCARIELAGHFTREGLSIPIRKQEIHYLVWTVSITSISDQIEGEFFYDLEQKVMHSSEIKSTYRFATVATRKEDKGRGKIVSENLSRMRLVSNFISAPPIVATRRTAAIATSSGAGHTQ